MKTSLGILLLIGTFFLLQKLMIFIIKYTLANAPHKADILLFIAEIELFGITYAFLAISASNQVLSFFIESSIFRTFASFILGILFADSLLWRTIPNCLNAFEYNSKNKKFIKNIYTFITTVAVVIITFSLSIKTSIYTTNNLAHLCKNPPTSEGGGMNCTFTILHKHSLLHTNGFVCYE